MTSTPSAASSAQSEHAPRRPLVVSVAVAFVYISGLFSVAIGILVLLGRYEETTEDEVLTVSLVGAGIILFGLLVVGIASGVARGSQLSRIVLTVYFAIEVVLHIWAIIEADWDALSVVLLALQLFTLAVLWLPATNRYFALTRS